MPENRKKSLQINQTLGRLSVLLGAFWLLILITHAILLLENQKARDIIEVRLDEINSIKYTEAEKTFNEISRLQEEIERIDMLLDEIGNSGFITSSRISGILELLPDAISTQEISLNARDKGIVYKGVTVERNQINLFVDNLYTTGEITYVELKSISTDRLGNVSFILEIYPLEDEKK